MNTLVPVMEKLSLRSIDLSGNAISGAEGGALCKSLAPMSSLESLDMSNNQLDDVSAEGIAALVSSRDTLNRCVILLGI